MKRAITLLLFCTLPLTSALGESNGALMSEVRAEYVRLRNIDPTTDDPGVRSLWRELENKMERASQVESTVSSYAALRLRIDRAGLLTRLFRVQGDNTRLQTAKEDITSALRLLNKDREPSAELQHLRYEALLLKSDIYLMEKDTSAAEEVLYLLQQPKDDNRILSRLSGIRNETFKRFYPAPELERPQLLSLSWGKRAQRGNRERKVIVIDPGHGGDDAGAVGKLGLLEKEVTLDLSRRVAQLATEMGIRVVLTRDDDTFVPLARRTRIANHLGASAFVSIHNNASPKHTLDGLESFYLDNTDDQAGKKLADRENSAGASGAADDIDFMLSDLIQTGKMEDSIRLTHMINHSLSRSFGNGSEGVTVRGVKKAPFFVLVGAHMPCTLLEVLFIDHPNDAERLAQARFRERAARAIVLGIATFLGEVDNVGLTSQEMPPTQSSQKARATTQPKKIIKSQIKKQEKRTRTRKK